MQERRREMKESLVLLALAALALLVAPSYPVVYGAGAVAAVMVMEAVHTPRPGIGERATRG
ncbi:hypothetical protein [Fervidobacterium sp.]